MGNAIESLKKYVTNRRAQEYDAFLSQLDHPERLPSDNVITLTLSPTLSSTATSEAKATTTKAVATSTACSEFYSACRNNQIDKVEKLLPTMTLDEIDKLEPNHSTALHAACYHGHIRIVRMLLEAGADRAIQNKYGCLPFDEALNNNIKELFFRVPNSNRLVGNTGVIEWELIDDDVLDKAAEERDIIKSVYNNAAGSDSMNKMFEKIEKNYINKGLANIHGIEIIKRFFQKATKEQDPQWIIKAYTAETDFYTTLNTEIAGGAGMYQSERRYIIALLSHHPILNNYTFIGPAYRVMRQNHDDLKKYEVDCCLMTKSFLSSSIDRKVAELFVVRQEEEREKGGTKARFKADGKVIKSWVMCIYQIKRKRTALHIENSSQYANEGEILIMPYTVFQVKNISQFKAEFLPDKPLMTQIELEEWNK
ncbi:unnamed protein product [Rotaria sp. Silwood1]|nr:unnamed protein product [Rotaria sp. Silwood1]CAF1544938.1 unnamed protein product [Rotaria sp. Silwood1]CAF3724752.1 unnamed protein product [Rotaria sp. Silwood1]CAF4987407.1 unnamed protein product [Rotaria sp. Silwood1]